MAYNNEVSMANMCNISEALNQGGMKSCEDIANTVWYGVSQEVRDRKIEASRKEESRTVHYALLQLRKEVRRSLNSYFMGNGNPYDLYSATAYKDVERFWTLEPFEDEVEVLLLQVAELISSLLGDFDE